MSRRPDPRYVSPSGVIGGGRRRGTRRNGRHPTELATRGPDAEQVSRTLLRAQYPTIASMRDTVAYLTEKLSRELGEPNRSVVLALPVDDVEPSERLLLRRELAELRRLVDIRRARVAAVSPPPRRRDAGWMPDFRLEE